MNYKNLKIITIIFLILFSANIFACTVTINQGIGTSNFSAQEDPNNSNRHLAKITLPSWNDHDIILTRQNCENKSVVLVIDDNKTINITNEKDNYKITGMDIVEFQNNSSIIFNINNEDNEVELTTIDINADIHTIPNTTAKLEFNEDQRSFGSSEQYRKAHGIKVISKNLFVEQDSNLVLNINSKDPEGGPSSTNDPVSGVVGGPAILDLNSITNYGDLTIDLKAASGGKGTTGKTKSPRKDGGAGGVGGDANISINFIHTKNSAKFNLNLKSGDGGAGGSGASEGGSPRCAGDPKDGGDGANGGLVYFNISDLIFDQSSVITVNLESGKGGKGGDSGKNHCVSDNADGGAGGNAGDIISNNINNLETSGDLTFSIKSGSGGNGGYKTRGGAYGSGGNGGDILDLNISNFINNSESTKIDLLSGKKGKNTSIDSPEYYGVAGGIGNININYLENNKRGLEIRKEVDQTTIDIISEFSCTDDPTDNFVETGDIYINYISSGSYLPKSLKTITAYPIDNTKIEINACYLKSSGLKKLEYQTGQLILNSANKEHILNDFDYEKSRILIFTKTENDCPICDALELTNLNRVDETYKIYSNNSGTIKARDLKIYYLKEDQDIFKPNYLGDNEEYVVYTNYTDINSQNSSQFSDAGLFEYVLSKENLFSPRYNSLLSEIADSKAYCPGQQYKIKFIITLNDGTTKIIEIPFIPTYGFE